MQDEVVNWPEGYGRRVLDEVDSTLDEAHRVAPVLSGPEWILARRQTKARGRRGRTWVNPEGNFAATLVLQPHEPPGVAALRSFIAALALRDALVSVCGERVETALKWPNDVLVNGGKVAGILLESIGPGSQTTHLAIGIGVNLAAAPPVQDIEAGALRPVSVLSEAGLAIRPEDFLTPLARAFAGYETQFQTSGFMPIRAAWLSNAARLGDVITARTAREEITGTFSDVDKDGQLVLETPKGCVRIPAADVYF